MQTVRVCTSDNPLSSCESNRAPMKKLFAIALALALIMGFVFIPAAYAQTYFTYSGTGILGKASVNTTTLSSGKTCYVKHTQKQVTDTGRTQSMTVRIEQYIGLNRWQTVGAKTYPGNKTNQVFSTYCPKGTYRLWFQSTNMVAKFNISGSFYS